MSTHLCVGLDHTGLWHSLHIAAYFGLLIDAGHLASAVHWWNMNNLFKQSNIFAAVESHKTHNEASVFLWYKIWYFMDLMLYLPSCDELEQFEGYSKIDLFVLCSVLWFCSIPAFCFLLYMKVFFFTSSVGFLCGNSTKTHSTSQTHFGFMKTVYSEPF